MGVRHLSRHGAVGFNTTFPRGLAEYPGKHTYAEALFYLRETPELTSLEKEWILGATAEKLLRWARADDEHATRP